MKIKKLIQKVIYPNEYSSEAFVEYLRSKGASIGNNTYFFAPMHTMVDIGRSKYIKVGDNCCITDGVKIICHDYSWINFMESMGEILPDPGGEVVIGNNCFIGMNAIILKNTTIGDNCIIGAGAVVTGNIPKNSVVGGVPAKIICTVEDMCARKKKDALKDACKRAQYVIKQEGRLPTLTDMGWFSVLFLSRNKENENFIRTLSLKGGNMEKALAIFRGTSPLFQNLEEFLEYAVQQKEQGLR